MHFVLLSRKENAFHPLFLCHLYANVYYLHSSLKIMFMNTETNKTKSIVFYNKNYIWPL